MPGGCGCAGNACSCTIQAGSGLIISGTGNSSAPFQISLAPSPDAIVISTAGPLDLSANGGFQSVMVTLNANATSVALPAQGGRIDMLVVQGTGGTHLITWPGPVIWPGGTEPVLSTAVGATDWITLIYAGGVWAGIRTAANLS
jgi:hypothetical protein